MKSAGLGCLATADAMVAQATERFGKKEKATCERPHEMHKAIAHSVIHTVLFVIKNEEYLSSSS